MRYIDTASRDANHALGAWLKSLIDQCITDFRIQSGYFAAQGIAPLVNLFQYLAKSDMPITCVVGSNDGETTPEDIKALIDIVGCPRDNARIAIISYKTGLYHPKLYHATRADGSQAAYVGSANLTSPGVSGLNIEAGLILDTADGDPRAPLTEIASAVEIWFGESADSAHIVRNADDISTLVDAGILGFPRILRQQRQASSTALGRAAVRLEPLISFSALPPISNVGIYGSKPVSAFGATGTALGVISPEHEEGDTEPPAFLLSVPRPELAPHYILFDPDATEPTQGAEALTCSLLPGGATGLIVQLNRDSARHFEGKAGTANVSIPVPTIGTLRFGVFAGKRKRPRCEFDLRMRFVDDKAESLCELLANTNVMVYGHAKEESGHGDVRLLIPRQPVQAIREFALKIRYQVPAVEDPMILEWPTSIDPCFKATFAAPDSKLYRDLCDAFATAIRQKRLVGKGACWFSSDLVELPDWNPVPHT